MFAKTYRRRKRGGKNSFPSRVLPAAQLLYLTGMFDCLIIVTCVTSFILCTRSVVIGVRLQCVSEPNAGPDWPCQPLNSPSWCREQEYSQYCRSSSGKDAPWSDKMEFVNGWYIFIIVSDTLSIVGSILKIEIQNKVQVETSQANCSASSCTDASHLC